MASSRTTTKTQRSSLQKVRTSRRQQQNVLFPEKEQHLDRPPVVVVTPTQKQTHTQTKQKIPSNDIHNNNNNNNNKPVKVQKQTPAAAVVASAASSAAPPVPPHWIDNTRLVYVRRRLPRSKVVVQVQPQVYDTCRDILSDLDQDVLGCLQVLPRSVHALVRRTVLWVNHEYSYGREDQPRSLNHSTAHHHAAWLLGARDRPDKALGIEIYNCWDYRRMRCHWNGCGLLLHELCHLLHQWVLGLENISIQQAHALAKASGRYHYTLRRDWAGKQVAAGEKTSNSNKQEESGGGGEVDMHYCLVDHKEFFAELSVTYLANGYPELDRQSCFLRPTPGQDRKIKKMNTVVACSPPLIEPTVVARVHKQAQAAATTTTTTTKTSTQESSASTSTTIVNGPALSRPDPKPLPHCNKFFPFTHGQLQRHDPTSYAIIDRLWTEDIAKWKDPQERQLSCDSCRGEGGEEHGCAWFWPKWLVWGPKGNALVDPPPTKLV